MTKKEKRKAYYEANKERERARDKAYREAHRDEIRAKDRRYREANKERECARARTYYKAHRDEINARRRAYREANKEELLAKARAYREANKEEIRTKKKARYEANKEENRTKKKAYYEAHRDELLAKNKAYARSQLVNYDTYAHRLVITDKPERDNVIDTKYLTVACKTCGKRMYPTHQEVQCRILCIEGKAGGEHNFYCSDVCRDVCPVYGFIAGIQTDPRSKKYIPPTEQQEARSCQTNNLKQLQCDEMGYTYCEKCGDIIDVELHHTLEIAKHGRAAINSAGHILLCPGCHVNMGC